MGIKIAETYHEPVKVHREGKQYAHPYPPAPFLPTVYRKRGWQTGEPGFVIVKGEPVTTVLWQSKYWTVPCVGANATCTVTYTADDVELGVEDIDTPGTAIAAAGTSSGYIPTAPPLGFAFNNQPHYDHLSDGTQMIKNWSHWTAETVRLDTIEYEIPYMRSGTRIINQQPVPTSFVKVGALTNLSASNRPYLQVTDLQQAATTDPTAGVISINFGANGILTTETIVVTVAGIPLTYTALTSGAVAANGEFNIGGTATLTGDNFVTTLAAMTNPRTSLVVGVNTVGVVQLTSDILGTVGDPTADTSNATDTTTESAVGGTESAGLFRLDRSASVENLAWIVGRVTAFTDDLPSGHQGEFENGEETGLYHVDAPEGFSVASRQGTGGVPIHLYVIGNNASAIATPTDYTEAGWVRVIVNKVL